jgi:hypothetical protein
MNLGHGVGACHLVAGILYDALRVKLAQRTITIHVAFTAGPLMLFDATLQSRFDDAAARPQRTMRIASAIGNHDLIGNLAIAPRQQNIAGLKLAPSKGVAQRARIVVVDVSACTDVIHSPLLLAGWARLGRRPHSY